MSTTRLTCIAFAAWIVAGCVSAANEPPWSIGRTSPAWADATPTRVRTLEYDPQKTAQQNGEALQRMLATLAPGDRLEIDPGRYSIAKKFNLEVRGTSDAPIWIVGADASHPPVITRPDAKQNVVNVGEQGRTEYLCLRHLEFTGGSTLIRLYDCRHLWLDQCHLHHAGAEGLTANSRDTSHLFITRNHFHDFTNERATGEAMYLGANQGQVAMSYSVIAHNHVHDCGGRQGDGIEVKQGSHHNWIYGNHVHDTNYPCIIVYGTGGQGKNVIEQNVCYRSGDNVLQVQGEAIVRNNLLIDGAGAGFASTDHQGKTSNLSFVHNTVISRGRGVNLSSWNKRANMLFANNAVYTDNGEAIRFPSGADGVAISGNVVVGKVAGVDTGFVLGRDLSDFAEVTWTASRRSAWPSNQSRLIGQGDANHTVTRDISGKTRGRQIVAGAFGSPR